MYIYTYIYRHMYTRFFKVTLSCRWQLGVLRLCHCSQWRYPERGLYHRSWWGGISPGKSGTLLGQLGLLMGITLFFFNHLQLWLYIHITYIHITYIYNIWLVVCNMAFMIFHILGRIIPTDFHIFQRGDSTTNQYIYNNHLLVELRF